MHHGMHTMPILESSLIRQCWSLLFPNLRCHNDQRSSTRHWNQSKKRFWQYLNAWGKLSKRHECVIPAGRSIMTTVAEKTDDYTTCSVPGACWSTENIPGASSGNDTNRECNLKLVFEKSIFSQKFGGFENYTCPRFTLVNPMRLKSSLDITALAYYSISFHRSSSGIQNLSRRHQKLPENQKFAYGHLGNLAPPGQLEESASHHVLIQGKHGEHLACLWWL